jgi:hypothetical protein
LYFTFGLSPLDQRAYGNNFTIVSAVATLSQGGCSNQSPYSASDGRVATLYDANYGPTLEKADCVLPQGSSVFLTDNPVAGGKTADVTNIVRTHWADRLARSYRSQFVLRLTSPPPSSSTTALCSFYLWGTALISQRPYLATTFEYD